MSKLTFSDKAWEEYLYWQTQDRKTLKRINTLLKDIDRNGFEGIGKPEPLKNRDGCWSRRIDECHRLVCKIYDGNVEIIQCKGTMRTDKNGFSSGGNRPPRVRLLADPG